MRQAGNGPFEFDSALFVVPRMNQDQAKLETDVCSLSRGEIISA